MSGGREDAERAFESLDSNGLVGWPHVAERIRQARLRRQLSDREVAQQVDLTLSAYQDLEARDDEAFTALAIADLWRLSQTLGSSPRALLLGDEDGASTVQKTTLPEISKRLRERMASEGLDADELSERIGWDISKVLADPEALWAFNVVGWRDVCREIGVDWVAALPDLTSARPN